MASITTTTTITCQGTASETLTFDVAGTRYVDVRIIHHDGSTLMARVAAKDLVHAFRGMENALVREVDNERKSGTPDTITLRTYRE